MKYFKVYHYQFFHSLILSPGQAGLFCEAGVSYKLSKQTSFKEL